MITMYEDYRAIMLNELERVYQYVNNHWFEEAEINNTDTYKSITLYYSDYKDEKRSNTEIYIKNNLIIVEHTLRSNDGINTEFTVSCNTDDEIISKVAVIEEMINEYNADTERQAESERAYFKKLYGFYPNM